jgi:hypothetical protein
MSTENIHHQEVSDRAYLLWQRAGKPEGQDLEFWLQAEAEVLGQSSSKTPPDSGRSEAIRGLVSKARTSRPIHRTSGKGPARAREAQA